MAALSLIEPEWRYHIYTGMDAILYFAAQGHMARIKLFHAIRGNPSGSPGPYDLLVCSKESIAGEYFTISASGVVHMCEDGTPAEFIPIGQWVREHSVFNIMKQLPFFKNYIIQRMFRTWRSAARAQHFEKVRQKLESRLFYAKPKFCFAVMDIAHKVYLMKQTRLVELEKPPLKLQAFVNHQEDVRKTKTLPLVCQHMAGIEQTLTSLFNNVMKTEAQLRQDVKELDTEMGGTSSVPQGGPVTQKPPPAKSIVKVKAERLEKMRLLRLAQQDFFLLPMLLKLTDQLLVEGSLDMVVTQVSGLADKLSHQPVISSQLDFAPEGMVFEVEEETVRQAIVNDLVDAMVQCVRSFPRIMASEVVQKLPPLPPHLVVDVSRHMGNHSPTQHHHAHHHARGQHQSELRSMLPKGTDLPAILMGYKPLMRNRLAVAQAIVHAYSAAHETVAKYEPLRPIHEFCQTYDPAMFKDSERTIQQFRRDMAMLKSWQDEVAMLNAGDDVGCLHLSGMLMKEKLATTLEKAMDLQRMMLVVAAHNETQRVLEMFQHINHELVQRPNSLDDFAAFSSIVSKTSRSRETYDRENMLVQAMYEMLTEYGGKIPPADQVVLDDTKEAVTAFGRALSGATAYAEERNAEMAANLDKSKAALFSKLGAITADLRSGKYDAVQATPSVVLEQLASTKAAYEQVAVRAGQLRSYEELFGKMPSNYMDVEQASKELAVHVSKWEQLHEFESSKDSWLGAPCQDLNAEEIQEKFNECVAKNTRLVKSRRDDKVVMRMKKELDDFQVSSLPVLLEVSNKALHDRHWEQILSLVQNQSYNPDKPLNASDLIDLGIGMKVEQVQAISAAASKEHSMLQSLEKMEGEWANLAFAVHPYKDTGTYVIGGTDEIQMVLDDQIVKIQSMHASPFVKAFKDRVIDWEHTLQTLQDMLDNWLQCQATWLYLEPIFSSDDIVKQMPEEGDKFRQVNNMWRAMMKASFEAPAAIPIARDPERLDHLVKCNRLLEEVQRGLAAYLERKRLFFPRFFFLSNDEMLEILSETKDPTRVQPHLKKCFGAIDSLEFQEDLSITAMNSVEGERVPLKGIVDTVKARGAVEKWLLQVEARMFEAVHDMTARGLEDYPTKPRHEWVLQWPGMTVLVVSGIFWTQGVTKALHSQRIAAFEGDCTEKLTHIVDLVRGDLTNLQRITLGSLVVMDVHARDVVTRLVERKVDSESDFEWQAQLRSYWEEDMESNRGSTINMRMMNATIRYGYEYLGNSACLVITPLTDRCYRTLMGAIHLTLGGAPEGPAGTGKTETVKDLAKSMARQCVVFNCSDSLDYMAMGKFFKGLASSGAWACFDEFNRIDLEVLSVVAQQVLDIQRAIAARQTSFVFEGTTMQLKWSAWCAITMNPGYAGRTELPDNLKALFRTVAMMVPDYAMIAEIILFSYGYRKARDLSKKIVQCYKLCSEQLSSQDHYDYGMRAVMAVLRAAGNQKRRFPTEDEFKLMLRSIVDVNLCKFLSPDVPLFQGIIGDLFPGVDLPKADYREMEQAMRDVCAKKNLQPTEYFMTKTTQLYEMIVVRHGLMVVGMPFSGKTASYRVLAEALCLMRDRGQDGQLGAEYHVINPKATTMGQLYGQFDPVSHEWTEGVLAVIFRQVASNTAPHRKWLVLDGPVDALWIENMNTVLDDNKKLCLNSGEIIQMSNTMNMIFEVMDLAVASPATVSRCGMVYVEPHQLGWRPLAISWLSTFPDHIAQTHKDQLLALFDWLVPVTLRFVRREIKEASGTLDSNLVTTLMRNITSLTSHLADQQVVDGMQPAQVLQHLECTFVFAAVWSLGGTGSGNADRVMFEQFFRHALTSTLPDYTGPSGERYTLPEDIPEGHTTLQSSNAMMPAEGSMYDFFFDKTSATWKPWSTLVNTDPIPCETPFRKIIIPSIDTVRYAYLLEAAVGKAQPVLLVGPTGTGKSVLVASFLNTLDPDVYAPANVVGFSAQTTANMVQHLIDSKLDRRQKGVFGPSLGKQSVVFVDDLNMPQPEFYGAQPPIELLRQYMDHGGWYDRQNAFRRIDDCKFVAAMGPPGGGRQHVTARYLRHFNTVSMTEFDTATMERIFCSIMDWGLDKGGFGTHIKEMRDAVVQATLDIYRKVTTSLLPTPAKSHYTFNLRDISRVMQGFLLLGAQQLPAEKEPAKDKYKRLWVHEVMRVFYDRLVEPKDRQWLLDFVKLTVTERFGSQFDVLFNHLASQGKGRELGIDEMRKLFFGDYMDIQDPSETDNQDSAPSQRHYDEISDMAKLTAAMEELLSAHNESSKKPMNLAIFLYAIEHVSRIARVLKQPGAHMLCVGVGGSGRQSLTRLASFIMGMQTFQIELSKTYSLSDWREDLKSIERNAGELGKPTVFLFSDTQIKNESFLVDINNLLNSGEVPNIFPNEERQALMETCRQQSQKKGLKLETAVEVWDYFLDTARENLHVVLCMSPVGDAFRERLRQFPSLVNCCTINWFPEWPEDALVAVAQKQLDSLPDVSNEERSSIVTICRTFHMDVRHLSKQYREEAGRINYVTPTSYLELLNAFTTLLGAKRAEVMAAKRRYEVGLEKLLFTEQQVVIMQNELTDLKPKLINTVAETERLMATVQKEKTEVVEPKKAIVDVDVQKAEEAANAANAIKKECEDALAEALPILEAALSALDTIKAADIKLVQSFKSPPSTIKLVMEAVCVLLDVRPTRLKDPSGSGKMIDDFWPSAQKVLTDPNFIKTLKAYDKDNVPPAIIERIREKYISHPDFTPANAAKASSAAEGLCKWVTAMASYDRVAKVVAPKRIALAEAEEAFAKVEGELKAKQADLKEVMDRLHDLESQLEQSMQKKISLEREVEECKQKLERAEKLIEGLGGEKARWTEAASVLGAKYGNLTGDMLISAGLISYLGAFTTTYRELILGKWVAKAADFGIPRSSTFSLVSTLGDPVKIRAWGIAGLPNDSFSIDNGIMVTCARRWPLMIDPQSQANKWVKAMEQPHDLRVIKFTDSDFMRTLENAIQFGIPVLLENVGEELDPSLEPLLLRQVFKQNGMNYLRFGDTTVEFSDQFRFYITTALRNPHYLPEVAVKVTLINFMITLEGLADQLLAVVVAQERPDLEAQRLQLVVESAENKRKLKEIEDRILHVLSSSQGNILEDASAIQILSEAKTVSNDITEKEVVATQTQQEIDSARVVYKPCGMFNAVLFFCIRDMVGIDPMYQYSLAWFIQLFIRSITASDKSSDLEERLKAINGHFMYSLYLNICRSLFEKDKLLFAFLLCARVMLSKKEMDSSLYQFLLTGGVGVPEKEVHKPAHAEWIGAKGWGEVCRAANISPAFAQLPEDIAANTAEWQAMLEAAEPHKQPPPLGYADKLSKFDVVLLLRMLRPDKVVPALQSFVSETLGAKYTEPPPFDLEGAYKESSSTTPLLFVLSPGTDPTAALLSFANAMKFGNKISVISMGQGQGPKAAALISTARRLGSWVLLQNCHLAPSWMPALEKLREDIKPDTSTHSDFRLWMTSMPSASFPVTILQDGVKMTNEPPAGLKANLRRSYALDPISSPEFFESCPQPGPFKALLFGLAFLHAVVQERRKFGPIGWNIPYGFDDGDLRISVRQLHMYLSTSKGGVPFDALRYSIGECNYGGRVTDDKDRRLLNALLSRIFQPEILSDDPFPLSASGFYVVPPEGNHASYVTVINTLPSFPAPEVYGLHENANISKDISQTQELLDTLLLTGGARNEGQSGQSDEALVAAMAKDILTRLPPVFDVEKAQAKFPVKYEESMNQVLCQEMLRFNRLIEVIRRSLVDIDKALQGLLVMSTTLDAVFKTLAIGAVPGLWKAQSYPSLKPLAPYVNDLLAKLQMLQDWYDHGQPSVFWISGFYFTPCFTTAALQNYARKHKLPIDTVGWNFVMLDMDPSLYTAPPDEGIYIDGLFLEGCGWDSGCKQLCESRPKVLFEAAPVMWLQPKPLDEINPPPGYSCPVYRTAERRGVLATTGHSTNFLMTIHMPSNKPEWHWILSGVCLLCSLTSE